MAWWPLQHASMHGLSKRLQEEESRLLCNCSAIKPHKLYRTALVEQTNVAMLRGRRDGAALYF